VEIGDVVRVLADDPAAANDIPAWCRMKDQQFLGSPEPHAFDVRRVS
jgi:tRNA 2-thiouridine synthesizing protein A